MISFQETRTMLREDRARLREFIQSETGPDMIGWLYFNPSYQAVFLHRWSHYFFCRERRLLARLLWHFNLLLTGADISPGSDIAGGLIIVHPLGVVIIGKVGTHATFFGRSGIGGGLSRKDVGAGMGFPIIGNGVTFEIDAIVLGPVKVGDNARIHSTIVTTDVGEEEDVWPSEVHMRTSSKSASVKLN